MLNIIGLILKVIGIILMVLIGIIIAAALLIFLVPIRYKATGDKTEDDIKLDVRVNWLLHFISFYFNLHGKDKRVKLRVLGIVLYDSARPKKKKNKKRKKKKRNKEKDDTGHSKTVNKNNDNKNNDNKNNDNKGNDNKGNDNKGITDNKRITDNKSIDDKNDELSEIKDDYKKNSEADEEKQTGFPDNPDESDGQGTDEGFINKIKVKIYTVYKNIVIKIIGILEKIKGLFDHIENLKLNIKKAADVFWTEEKKKLYLYSLKILFKMMKHILPRKIKGNIIFGTGNPYSTGQAFTCLGMFYGVYGNYLNVAADFEVKRFDADIKAKGKIRLIILTIFLIKLFNKEFRTFVKELKNINDIFGKS